MSNDKLAQAPGELTETIDSGSSPEYRALQEHRVMRNARAAPKQAEQHAAEQAGASEEPAKQDPARTEMESKAGYWTAFTHAMATLGASIEPREHRGRRGWDCTVGATTVRARATPEAALYQALNFEFDGQVPAAFCLPTRSSGARLVRSDCATHKQPAGHGMATQALAVEIIEALLADEKDGGYDLPSGLFGPAFSALVRRWAALELAAPKQAEQHAAEQVGDADGPDLVARGMGWEETVKTCREGVEQAGFSWDKVSPMALNIMQRVANAAHKAGFELGKQRALAAVPKQDAHHARLYRFLRESTPLAVLQFIAVHSDTPEEFDAALTAYMVKHEAALSRLNPARHPGAPEAPQGELF